MRRADRLFDKIQLLRGSRRPLTAAALASELEVTVRTVYRDVATLQARRVPIEGTPGIGYVLRRGFDLPPHRPRCSLRRRVFLALSPRYGAGCWRFLLPGHGFS
jgi:predicted DNA-binding transcriptional regulator YafY